jgi:hypothetical protein
VRGYLIVKDEQDNTPLYNLVVNEVQKIVEAHKKGEKYASNVITCDFLVNEKH